MALRAMLDTYEPMHPELLAFRDRLVASLSSEQDLEALWATAVRIKNHLVGSYFWNLHVDACERLLEAHEKARLAAMKETDLMPSCSDDEIEHYLYSRSAHCDDCAKIALQKVPDERLAPIWANVRRMHRADEEDEMEARQSTW